jgi:hypothetical protein
MKFASIATVLSISSMVAAAPIIEPRNLIPGLPRPMEAVEALYPGSGIPKLASKLEKTLNLCMYICSDYREVWSAVLMRSYRTGYERVVFSSFSLAERTYAARLRCSSLIKFPQDTNHNSIKEMAIKRYSVCETDDMQNIKAKKRTKASVHKSNPQESLIHPNTRP